VGVIIQPDAQRISLELQNLEKGIRVTPTGTRVGCAANRRSWEMLSPLVTTSDIHV